MSQPVHSTRTTLQAVLLLLSIGIGSYGSRSAAQSAPSPPAPRDPIAARALTPTPPAPPLVLAQYFPWYGLPGSSGGYRHIEGLDTANRRIGNFAHFPLAGPYDSQDEATMLRHLREAKQAGIDALVCSWWGPKDPTDAALRKLLPLAAREGIKVCAYVEHLEGEPSATSVATQCADLLRRVGSDPAYLKVAGKPVFFVFGQARTFLDPDGWAEALLSLPQQYPTGAVSVTDGTSTLDAMIFDGLHVGIPPLAVDRRGSVADAARGLERVAVSTARRRRRIAVATVFPGFDDRKVSKTGFAIERERGRIYRDTWEGALAAKPDWVLIRSFNNWHDGTEIEPSVEYGDEYLRITAEYATRFKAITASR